MADWEREEEALGEMPGPPRRGGRLRRLAIDVTPLRENRDFRILWTGELISMIGRQITVVALPYQVFVLTGSNYDVGMIGLVQLVPLVLVTLAGGQLVDRWDRRKLIVVTEAAMAGATGLLLWGALHGHPPLWFLYLATALSTAISAVNWPARTASVPNLVSREQLPAALALNQVMFNGSMIVGPAAAGIILARLGLPWTYAIDMATSLAAVVAGYLLRPLPPQRAEGELAPSGWSGIREGFDFLRGRRVLIATFLIDLVAMIFGMPRALFPTLALDVFHVGTQGLGFMYAALALGAMAGALTTGWVSGVKHQGRAVVWAVVVWGAAIVGFGLSAGAFWLALSFLAVAGAADVISAVFRGTILQLSVPDSLRGRLSAIHIMVVTGGPRLGDFEAGVVAQWVSPAFSVISGGVLCILGVGAVVLYAPELWRYHAGDDTSDIPHPGQ